MVEVGGGTAVATRITGDPDGNDGLYYLHSDHLGSASAMSDANGNQVGDITRYLPFGSYRSGGPNPITDRGFTGQKENIADLGLYYYNARYYAPGMGRFLSADPLVPDPTSPQSFNRYSYVENRPLVLTDPSGHCATDPYDDYYDYECWKAAQDLYNKIEGVLEVDFETLGKLDLYDLGNLDYYADKYIAARENASNVVKNLPGWMERLESFDPDANAYSRVQIQKESTSTVYNSVEQNVESLIEFLAPENPNLATMAGDGTGNAISGTWNAVLWTTSNAIYVGETLAEFSVTVAVYINASDALYQLERTEEDFYLYIGLAVSE